jgi:hypothetical protein
MEGFAENYRIDVDSRVIPSIVRFAINVTRQYETACFPSLFSCDEREVKHHFGK